MFTLTKRQWQVLEAWKVVQDKKAPAILRPNRVAIELDIPDYSATGGCAYCFLFGETPRGIDKRVVHMASGDVLDLTNV